MVTDGQERRDAVLRHISRYGLTLRPVLAKLFYPDHEKSLDRDLVRLREYGWITVVENAVVEPTDPQTKYSYYQLATPGARRISASKSRVRKQGGEALARNLAILSFCCMRSQRRHRLSEEDLAQLFGAEAVFAEADGGAAELRLRGFHCLDRQGDRLRVLNLYAPRSAVPDVIAELRKRVREVRAIPSVGEALRRHQYGYAVLAETTAVRDELRTALAATLAKEGAVFVVTQAPSTWKLPAP